MHYVFRQFNVSFPLFLFGALECTVRAGSCISEVVSSKNTDAALYSWLSAMYIILLSCEPCSCVFHTGVNAVLPEIFSRLHHISKIEEP
jgi:hypothetical protein